MTSARRMVRIAERILELLRAGEPLDVNELAEKAKEDVDLQALDVRHFDIKVAIWQLVDNQLAEFTDRGSRVKAVDSNDAAIPVT